MTTIDPTGLISVLVQRIEAATEKEIFNQLFFKDVFEDLADDLRAWNPLLDGFDNSSSSDPALSSWLNSFHEWMKETEALIKECESVAEARSWSFHSINNKRKLSVHVKIMRKKFTNLTLQIPMLILRNMTLPQTNHSRYLKQVIPDQLVLVQRIAAIEEQSSNLVLFNDVLEDLVDDLRAWKPLLGGFDNFSPSDPALSSWLNSTHKWMKETESFIKECESVAEGRPGSLHRINNKRELSEHIKTMREEFTKLILQIPVLILRNMTFHHSGYLKQVIPDQLVSMEEQLQQILEKLISPASSKWVGICGQGGSGKTIIAKQVNNSAHVVTWFGCQVLFLVIGGAASKKDVLLELCKLVGCPWFSEQDREEKLQSVVYTALQGKRVLLIVDDVWDESFLDLVEVVDRSAGSKIFVTTRNEELLLGKHAEVFYAGLMLRETSRKLFYNHAFGVGQDCFKESVRECAGEIIRLCKGLPLALAIVGSAMAKKPKKLSQWQLAARSIKAKCRPPGCEVKGLFQYSYDQLGKVEQECFLTMLSFPEDSFIQASEVLVPWWRGEDLIGPLSECGREEAEEILETLVSSSLIQKGSHFEFQIHDVILELGLDHLLKDESVLQEHERGHLFLSSSKHRERFLHYARTDPTKLRNVRKISCMSFGKAAGKDRFRFEEQVSQALLKMVDFPDLKTIAWEGIQTEDVLGKALAHVVKNSCQLEVFMTSTVEGGEVPLTFEFTNDQLRTLTLEFTRTQASNWRITILPHSLKWLRLEGIALQLVRPQYLENPEVLHFTDIDKQQLHYNFRSLSSLTYYITRPQFVTIPGLELSNVKSLLLCGGKVWWPSGALPPQLPKLESMSVDGIEGGTGGEWIRMLSGGCPNLTSLYLDGSLAAIEFSVKPPPRLPALDWLRLFHTPSADPQPIFTTPESFKLFGKELGLLPPFKRKRFCKIGPQRLPRFASRLTNLPVIDVVDEVYPHSTRAVPSKLLRVKEFQTPGLPTIVTHAAPNTLRRLTVEGFTLSETQAAALHQLQHLKHLHLRFEGPLPQSLLGLPGAFLQLRDLTLRGNIGEFPRVGEGSLQQLTDFRIKPKGVSSSVSELVIGTDSLNPNSFKLEKLKRLTIADSIPFKLLPVEVITSPSFKDLEFSFSKELEKLVLEPDAELKVAGSSLESLHIKHCDRMTVEGIPEVFKKMHQNGQLRILINGEELEKRETENLV